MRFVFLALAALLFAGALAFADNPPALPSSSASGGSLGADRYVPALEARAEYVTCRVDHQITVLDELSLLAPGNPGLLDTVASLETAKDGLVASASNGNLSVFNSYVRENVEPAMRISVNLTRETRRELVKANQTNVSSLASIYKQARDTRLECEKNAREHARDLAKMALQERVNATKAKIEVAREKMKERVQGAKDKLSALRERIQARLNNSRMAGNGTGNFTGNGVMGRNFSGEGNPLRNGSGQGMFGRNNSTSGFPRGRY